MVLNEPGVEERGLAVGKDKKVEVDIPRQVSPNIKAIPMSSHAILVLHVHTWHYYVVL